MLSGGEKLKRKMVVFPVLVLFIFLAVAPALTIAAVKVPATATISNWKASPGPDTNYWVVADSVVQIRNWLGSGVLSLHIDSSPAKDYVLQINTVVSGTVIHEKSIPPPYNWPEAKGIWTHEMICSYEVGNDEGTFEGIWNLKSVGWYAVPISPTEVDLRTLASEGHVILHGTGIFEGMILYLDTVGPSTSTSAGWTGYAMIH